MIRKLMLRRILLWSLPPLIVGALVLGVRSRATSAGAQTNRWTTYRAETSGLSSNWVDEIAIDNKERVWIGTDQGISVYDGESWIAFSKEDVGLAPESDNIDGIVFDEKDRAWVFTRKGAVRIFADDTWTTFQWNDSSYEGVSISSIAFDLENRVWLGTSGEGVYVFDAAEWTINIYNSTDTGLLHDRVSDIVFDNNGQAWIGTKSGISVFDGESWTNFHEGNSDLVKEWITSITIDQHGRVWIGTFLGGAAMYHGDVWSWFTEENGHLPDNIVLDIAIDHDDRAWIMTTGGLSIIDVNNEIAYVGDDTGLPVDRGAAIAADNSRNIWIGHLPPTIFIPGGGVIVVPDDYRPGLETILSWRYLSLPQGAFSLSLILALLWVILYVDLPTSRRVVFRKPISSRGRFRFHFLVATGLGWFISLALLLILTTITDLSNLQIVPSLGMTPEESIGADFLIVLVGGAGFVGGSTGILQWFVIRKWIKRAGLWAFSGLIGYGAGTFVGLIAGAFLSRYLSGGLIIGTVMLMMILPLGLALLLASVIAAIIQWFAVRKHSSGGWLIILANPIALLAAIVLSLFRVGSLLGGGLVLGAITGLVWDSILYEHLQRGADNGSTRAHTFEGFVGSR